MAVACTSVLRLYFVILAKPMTGSQRTSVHSTTATEKKKTSPPAVSYQPLTLGALMEYATEYSAPGHGNFKFGTRPMWVVQEKTV